MCFKLIQAQLGPVTFSFLCVDLGMDSDRSLVAGRSQREKRRSYKDLLREEEEIAAQVRKTSKKRLKVSPRQPDVTVLILIFLSKWRHSFCFLFFNAEINVKAVQNGPLKVLLCEGSAVVYPSSIECRRSVNAFTCNLKKKKRSNKCKVCRKLTCLVYKQEGEHVERNNKKRNLWNQWKMRPVEGKVNKLHMHKNNLSDWSQCGKYSKQWPHSHGHIFCSLI